MDNLQLWDKVEKTDPAFTKDVPAGGGRTYTAIDAYYRVKNATEQFGSYGIGWWVEDERFDYTSVPELCVYTAVLGYRLGERVGTLPIHAAIKTHSFNFIWENKVKTNKKELVPDEDFIKKVTTDALTKGLSFLGFNSDVYLHKFEDANYRVETAKALATLPEDVKLYWEFQLGLCLKPIDVQIEYSKATSDLKQNKEWLEMVKAKQDELLAIEAQELFSLSEEESKPMEQIVYPSEEDQPINVIPKDKAQAIIGQSAFQKKVK